MEKNKRKKKGRRKPSRYSILKKRHHLLLMKGAAAIAVIVFVVNLVTPARTFSENENRNLALRPAFSISALADGSFFSDYTTYFADQFFLRDAWTSLNFKAQYAAGKRVFSGVTVGSSGQLFGEQTVPDEEANSRTQEAILSFCEAHPDINYYMLVAPDAAEVLTDLLPKNAQMRDQGADIAAFEEPLAGRIQMLDALSVLKEHSEEYIYYKTDHHWTSLGAKYVFDEAASALGIENTVSYTEYWVSDSFQGTLSSRSGDQRETDSVAVYDPSSSDVRYVVNYPDSGTKKATIFETSALEAKDHYTVFFGGNHPLVEISTTANNGRSILIFKDSYANSFIQFLIPYYDRIILVDPRYYYDDVGTALNTYGISDVMFLYSADTLLSDTVLADTLEASGSTPEQAPDTEVVTEDNSGETSDEENTEDMDSVE